MVYFFYPVTDLDIQAYVDNELPENKRLKVKNFIITNKKARYRFEALVIQKILLKKTPYNTL